MATINKLPKKQRQPKQRNEDEIRQLRKKAYNYTPWRKLRETYFHEHPLCANCLKQGKVVAGEDVHHRISPFQNGEINYNLLMDPDNLETLCKVCHGKEHGYKNNTTPEEMLALLEELMEDIPDED